MGRRFLLSSLGLAVTTAAIWLAVPIAAQADLYEPFNAQETGTFTLEPGAFVTHGCDVTAPCGFTYSGTITSGTPIQTGTFSETGTLFLGADCSPDVFGVGWNGTMALNDAGSPGSSITKTETGTLCTAGLGDATSTTGTFTVTGGTGEYASLVGSGSFTAASEPGGPMTSAEQGTVAPGCPAGTTVEFHWHSRASGINADDHGWSPTGFVTCPGSLTIPSTSVKVTLGPGTPFEEGYAFRVLGYHSPFVLEVTSPQADLSLRCVSGIPPLVSSASIPVGPDQLYPVTSGQWTPTSDPSSPLTFQTGEEIAADLCQGGDYTAYDAGFTANVN
jgi:hypothetical protein